MNLRVVHSALDTTQANLKGKADQIDAVLARMDQDLMKLSGSWDGQTKVAYQAAKDEWTKAMQAMQVLLMQISVGVGEANADFSATDRSNAALFS
ncbi:MAG: WXG100 family type VII secretion target [Propionibacteriaceae bacterium]|nr:WXG100 family type VII secretion target [Propionibacteriaceae bacterium]